MNINGEVMQPGPSATSVDPVEHFSGGDLEAASVATSTSISTCCTCNHLFADSLASLAELSGLGGLGAAGGKLGCLGSGYF